MKYKVEVKRVVIETTVIEVEAENEDAATSTAFDIFDDPRDSEELQWNQEHVSVFEASVVDGV